MKATRQVSTAYILSSRVSTLFISVVIFVLVGTTSSRANANPMKEFTMSATYGVLAGTLVGAASLAFTSQPGENLSRVARGASLGLYLGMALGAYVVYVVPKQLEKENDIYQQPGFPPPEGEGDAGGGGYSSLQIFPVLTDKGIEGVAMNWNAFSF